MRHSPATWRSFGVPAGGGGVGDHDVVLRCPADAHRRGGPWPRRARLAVRLWLLPGWDGRALPVHRADHLAGRGPAWRALAVSADGAAQHRPVSGIAEPDL